MARPARSRTRSPTGTLGAALFTCLLAGGLPAAGAADAGDATPHGAALAQAQGPVGLARLIEQARELLARGRAEEARQLLAPQVRWYAGSPRFDYLLGISAMDAGRPGEAILAFERVLAVEPGHLQARAELARAYLAVNETESARRQFELVAAERIPPEVRRVIDGYLERIGRIEASDRTQFGAHLQFGAGWDSNVTLGSAAGEWQLGSGISVTPEGVSRPIASAVLTAGAGAFALVPIGGGWEVTAGGQLTGHWNPSVHTLDLGALDLSGGLHYRTACHQLSMLALVQHLRVNRARFRDAAGATAQWRCDLDARTQLGAYLQHFDLRFAQEPVRDARRTLLGATLARVLGESASTVAIANAYAGDEVPRADVPQLRHRIHGARATLAASLPAGWRGSASLSWERRRFAGEEPLFGAVRSDRQIEIRVGAERGLGRNWTIQPQVVHTRNASTLAPNDYRRLQASVTARYAF